MNYSSKRYDFHDKAADYVRLADELSALLAGEHDRVANAANTTALIFDALPNLNWSGFYFVKDGALLVGPFQGKPACVRIEIGMGNGVCGTAAASRSTIVVPDVHAFPGHIACDAASRSEIVIPLLDGARLIGVLDLDSPIPNRFDAADREGLERLAAIFLSSIKS